MKTALYTIAFLSITVLILSSWRGAAVPAPAAPAAFDLCTATKYLIAEIPNNLQAITGKVTKDLAGMKVYECNYAITGFNSQSLISMGKSGKLVYEATYAIPFDTKEAINQKVAELAQQLTKCTAITSEEEVRSNGFKEYVFHKDGLPVIFGLNIKYLEGNKFGIRFMVSPDKF